MAKHANKNSSRRIKTMRRIHRREFLKESAAAAAIASFAAPGLVKTRSPNEKLNIAVIGVAGRGEAQLSAAKQENVVALCDVDSSKLGAAAAHLPGVKTFRDFRRMFDKMHRQIDAVTVSTADHTHAVASMMAMRLGKHCYCEKPLAHSVFEVRTMTDIARQNKLATQLGTQIHAGANYRRAVEWVQSGVLGEIREVHVWLGANFQGPARPTEVSQPDAPKDRPPVPANLDWDLWLGPAPFRPYHPAYAPFSWRYWWSFANGVLGDFFCHYCDLAFWALGLRYPTTVEAEGPVHPESTARWTIARQQYPARGNQPPVTLTWYHGGAYPAWVKEKGVPLWGSAVLFVGSKGMLIADYGQHQLLPKGNFAGVKARIPDSIGHHEEWIKACKSGSPTTCNFEYSGPLTEAALLCNVALRTGKKLQWDPAALKAINCPEADKYLRREYRKGWTL
jgi:predicted dehydrogenase